MEIRKEVFRLALYIVAAIALLGPTRAATAQRAKVETSFATVGLTQQQVSTNSILQFLGSEAFKIKVRQLDEAAIYRNLMAGKIDLGSVLALPEDVGVKNFEKAFKQPPKVLTVGYLAVTVIAPKKTGVCRLSVAQLGQVVSGKITTWEQLGGSGGKIKIITDQNAVDLICSLAGVKPTTSMRILSHPTMKIAAEVSQGSLEKDGDLYLGISSANGFILAKRKFEGAVLVSITAVADAKLVAPTLDAVRNGSYPLARPWRLILRPGAPGLAKRCLNILANPRGKRGQLPIPLEFWLIEPAVSPISNHIRIGIMGWYYELKAAAEVYKRKNPQVTFTFLIHDFQVIPKFINAQVDLLAHTGDFSGHLGGPNADLWRKAFPTMPAERTIAYWPFAVIVHPKNPIESMTMEQLHRLAGDSQTRWKDLGRPKDGRLRLYIYHTHLISRAIWGYDLATGRNNGPRRLKPSKIFACRKYRVQVRDKTPFVTMAQDVDCIGIWYHDDKLAASGLKVLPIVSGKRNISAKPTDLPVVASGRYVLRTPLKVLSNPKADKTTRDFVKWLASPQAAQAMLVGKVRELADCSNPLTVAHVSLAAKNTTADNSRTSSSAVVDGVKFNERVDGAVAILPPEPLSRYFLMADRSHHAAYEQAITKTLEADGRLKCVDRTQLTRVLAEREIELSEDKNPRPGPIVAADVFILSHVVTEGTQAYLRIQAVHGPTAGLLGELKLRIDPAGPARFTPPLEQTVGRWWPGVLKRLVLARTKPVWSLQDVYAAKEDLGNLVDEFRQSLRKTLAADERVFLAGSVPFSQSQREVLMRLLGLSRQRGGRFTPVADYILDARVPSAGKIELRIRDGKLALVQKTTLADSDPEKLRAAAGDWLAVQIAEYASKPKPLRPSTAVENNWAKKQARVEYKIGMRLRKEYYGMLCRCYNLSPQEQKEFARLTARYRQTFRRAAQLDPMWEDAAYAALYTYGDPDLYLAESSNEAANQFTRPGEGIDAAKRFLKTFPKSKYYEEVLSKYAKSGVHILKAKIPPGLDAKSIKVTYMRKGLEGYARYMEKYRLTGKADEKYQAYMCFTHYLSWVRKYITLAEPSEQELREIVDDWSNHFDGYPDKAPHSDFVRLIILRHKADKPGYLALLTKLQQRWPDPKHPQWKETRDGIRHTLSRMFSKAGTFHLWLMGKRGIGDLPYVGYDAAVEARKEKELRGQLSIYCRDCKKAMQAASAEFKKLHPKVEFRYLQQHGDDKLMSAAEGWVSLIVYVGLLTAEEKKRLSELYRGRLPEKLIGYMIKPGSSKREPVMLLPGPKAQEYSKHKKYRILDEFVKFLATPEPASAMAKHNVYIKGATSKTTGNPASRPAALKEN